MEGRDTAGEGWICERVVVYWSRGGNGNMFEGVMMSAGDATGEEVILVMEKSC